MNTETKVGIGAFLVIAVVFDIWSGHLSFLRDLVTAIAVAVGIRAFLTLTKAKNSN